jgi:hypothetical protein
MQRTTRKIPYQFRAPCTLNARRTAVGPTPSWLAISVVVVNLRTKINWSPIAISAQASLASSAADFLADLERLLGFCSSSGYR